MEVTKEQILELMTSAYMTAHQQTVDGIAMSCRQGTLEECEDIFESEFEQSPETGQVDAIVIRPKFWFMRDNHTFAEIKGNSLDEIRANAYKLAEENPYGMVCPVKVLKGDEEVRRVGEAAHVDGKGGVDLGKWLNSIIHDKDILKNLGE